MKSAVKEGYKKGKARTNKQGLPSKITTKQNTKDFKSFLSRRETKILRK